MARIGRNEPCPCGSGNKYKKCCLGKDLDTLRQQPQRQLSLQLEVERTQQLAENKENSLNSLGVFIFLTTDQGDGWVLEITAMDALQVAEGGRKIDVEINEGDETIEVNWSHKFAIKNKKFVVTSYKGNKEKVYEDYPASRIKNLVIKSRKKFPKEMLDQVHIDED